ncbi:hypothetical protein ACOSQ2_016787 [Xanthoceras sorbifolium]
MSHIGESSRTPQGRRRSGPLIVHPQFAERMKKGEKWPLQLKRGINIDVLNETGIQEVHPNDDNDKLVREFYASMVPDDLFAWGTVVRHQFFTVHNPDMAGSLQMDEHRYWSNSNNRDLFHADLDFLSAFWHVFCDHSILPKAHWTTLTFPIATVLFSLQQDNGPFLVRNGANTLVPKEPLGRTTYNKLVNASGAPGLLGHRVRQGWTNPIEMRIRGLPLRVRTHRLRSRLLKSKTKFSQRLVI